MTKRECKKIAMRIAKLEQVVATSSDKDEKKKAQEKIMQICGSFKDLEDMIMIDEAVQKILQNS